MTVLFAAFLLLQQSAAPLALPPRSAIEDPRTSGVPDRIRNDYENAWRRFLNGREDARVVRDLERMLDRRPDFAAGLILQACVDLYAARNAEAERKLEAALDLAPRHPAALHYLAELAYARQDYARAARYYGELAAAGGSSVPDLEIRRQRARLLAVEEILNRASNAVQEGNLDAAADLYREALEVAPEEPNLHWRLGQISFEQKQWEEALRSFRKHLELGGSNPEAERYIAESLRNLGAGPARSRQQTDEIAVDVGDSPAAEEIQSVIRAGVLLTLPNHRFEPAGPLTRGALAEALARLSRLLGVFPAEGPPIPTADLDSSSALFADVQLVLSHGILPLDTAGNFNAAAGVPGEEAVAAVEQLYHLVRERAE